MTQPSTLPPIPELLTRISTELAGDFDPAGVTKTAHAPTIAGAVAVALQSRADRQLHLFSFNQYDQQLPFTLRMPLEALARSPLETVKRELAEPGRQWARPVVLAIRALHDQGKLDLLSLQQPGLSLAILSTPAGPTEGVALEKAVVSVL